MRRLPLSFVLWVAASQVGVTQAARPFSLEDITAFRTIEEIDVSRDGARVALVVRSADLAANRYSSHIWLVATGGAPGARQATLGDGSESWPRFSPDGSQLAFLAERGGSTQVWALPLVGGDSRVITSHRAAVAAFEWSPDGERLLFLAAPPPTEEDSPLLGQQWRNQRLWLARAADGAVEPLTDGAEHVRSAVWSPDGRRIAFVATPTPEADSTQEAKARLVDVTSRAVTDVPEGGRASALAFSPDGRSLAFTRPFDGREISREDLYVWTIGSPAPRDVSAAVDRDVEAARWHPDGASVDVLHSRGTVSAVARVGLAAARVEALWSPPHPLTRLERSGERWVYVPGDRPHELWIASSTGAGARPLTALNAAAADAVELPTLETVRWTGPQGEIEAVLVKPRAFEPGRRYPLLVKPHGGPRDHVQTDFDPQIAYFASLGYVVLLPNFRGSTGYGDAFTRGNVADWGARPFADVMSGVDALVERGIADPGRLFLYGWSYGGYLANWAITHTARFRAAASGAGVADLRMQYAVSDARRWRFDYFGGSPFAGHSQVYERESPITYVRSARVPTLFVHGRDDVRCPLSQGLMMYRGLRDNGVEAELLVYPREGHSFAEPRHVLDRARRIAEWFARFDARVGSPPPAPASSRATAGPVAAAGPGNRS